MYCPKCGFPEVPGDECPQCGIFVSKYLVALERKKVMNSGAEAAALWEEAYKLHYSSEEKEKAIEKYRQIIERYPDSQEASYANRQIALIAKERNGEIGIGTAAPELHQPIRQEISPPDGSHSDKKLRQYTEKDFTAINLYLWLSIIGGIVLFFFGVNVGSYTKLDGSPGLTDAGLYIIAISFASVLLAVIFAGIASDIRETRNVLLHLANELAERRVDNSPK